MQFEYNNRWFIINLLGFISIFSFFIPLFLVALPSLKTYQALEHNKNMTMVIQTNISRFKLFCFDDLQTVYKQNGVCFDPIYFSGDCQGKVLNTILVDLFYDHDGSIYRDTITNSDIFSIPSNFNNEVFNQICVRDWIFNTKENVFVDNFRNYAIQLNNTTNSSSRYSSASTLTSISTATIIASSAYTSASDRRHNYQYHLYSDWVLNIVCISVIGSMLGLGPICLLISVLTWPMFIYQKIQKRNHNVVSNGLSTDVHVGYVD